MEVIINVTDKVADRIGATKRTLQKNELIRCRNCSHYHDEGRFCILTQFPCQDRDYCSWAERKEE